MKKKRRPPPRVFRHLRPCPDCAAEFVDRELMHEDSCPLSAAVDAICDEDRQWFLDHPEESTRTRPITRAERQTMLHVDPAGASAQPNHVHVLNLPWGRIRGFCNYDDISSLAFELLRTPPATELQ